MLKHRPISMKLYRKISLFAIFSSTIVIICNLFLLSLDSYGGMPLALNILNSTLSVTNLDLFGLKFDFGRFLWTGIAFELLFLLGGLLYLNKGKKMRILRFVFSVILLSKTLNLLTSFVYIPIDAANENLVTGLLFFLYYRVADAAWIYLSFRVLKYMNGTRELEVISTEEFSAAVPASYVASSKGTRMLHLVIDTIMMVLIFSGPMSTLLQSSIFGELFTSLVATLGPDAFATILLSFVTPVYYIFFEVIVQASPAKFLTETRVLTINGKPIDFPTAIARTLCRWIPFDAFSFLFSANGWHDRFSGTAVIQEKENSEEKDVE